MSRFIAMAAVLFAGGCSHQGAIESAQMSVLRNPNEVSAWVALGDAYKRGRDGDSATSAYQSALSLDPGNEQIMSRLGDGRSSEVREMELQVLASPENDELWGDLGDLYAAMGDRDTALRHYQYALSLDPDDGEWQGKVMDFAAGGDLDQMMEMMADSTDDERVGDLADALRADGREEEACAHYLRAMALDPADNEWITALGSCSDVGDLYERVRDEALATNDDERIGDAGDLFMSLDRTDEACELYARALELDPDDSEWIGNLEECGGTGFQPQEGRLPPIRGQEGRLPLGGPSSDSLIALGRSALAGGDRSGALQHFEAALLDSPSDRDARVGVMALTGRTLVALLEELTTQRADDDELWGDLGDAYLESARTSDAIRAFRRAEELDPDDFEWQSKLDVLEPSRMGAE